MPSEPTDPQRRAVDHAGGPLVVLGGPGTGKTHVLAERFTTLVRGGTAPESILLLALTGVEAARLRVRVEGALGDVPFSELHVLHPGGLAARLLRDEAVEAGIEPFVVAAGPADRLAMLLDHVDELRLHEHDLGADPAVLLRRVIARIDRLKREGIIAGEHLAWAEDVRDERELEFAALWASHDRLLGAQGLLDHGDVVNRAVALLRSRPHVRARAGARFGYVLADDVQDWSYAEREMVALVCADHGRLVAAGDDDASIARLRGASRSNLDALLADPSAAVVALDTSFRCPTPVLAAAEAVLAGAGDDRLAKATVSAGAPVDRDVAFWRCAGERAQAQGVAAEVERLVRDGVAPSDVAILVRGVRAEGQAFAVALEERAVPHRVVGAAAFFQRPEVRDVLAWLRLLSDPGDAGAVVRALARPPIELRSADLARCVQIGRRRKLDMVGGVAAALESPQIPPEARERVSAFLRLQRAASGALDTSRPDLFVHRLIDRLGLRRAGLFAAQADVVEGLVALARLGDLASSFTRRRPQATPREFARYLVRAADAAIPDDEVSNDDGFGFGEGVAIMPMSAARGLGFRHVFVCGLQASRMPGARRALTEPIPDALLHEPLPPDTQHGHVAEMARLLALAMTRASEGLTLCFCAVGDGGATQPPSPFVEAARSALDASWEDVDEELFGPDEALHATFTALRDELLAGVPTVATRMGELRLDTDLDVTHGVVRYLELLKIAALMERPSGVSVADALPDVNARLLAAVSSHQREVFTTSALDEVLLDAERDSRARARALAAREEPSLEPFLPRRGEGLVLSASDIETYRMCPLKYKFARVFRIPTEPTVNQRFGIAVHQVLERFHADQLRTEDQLLGLFDVAWRRQGFGDGGQEAQLRSKAVTALQRYHGRFASEHADTVWLEKGFQFRLGRHTLRGRVDRVDRLVDGSYELIDYKTGRPRTRAQLREDVQLSLYAVGARQAWDVESSAQAYWYVLDDEKVEVPAEDIDPDWIADTVDEVGEGIMAQGFEPTPSYAACSMCDYRIVCPAAER